MSLLPAQNIKITLSLQRQLHAGLEALAHARLRVERLGRAVVLAALRHGFGAGGYMLVAPPTMSGRITFSPSLVKSSACLSA